MTRRSSSMLFLAAVGVAAVPSHAAQTILTDLDVGPGGYLSIASGDQFLLSGSFLNSSTQRTLWNTIGGEVIFRGGASHRMDLPGSDLGAVEAGFTQNFAWGKLTVSSGQSLTLMDTNALGPAALYVREVSLANGVAQLAQIAGNGCSIYYDPSRSSNGYLRGLSYALPQGGTLSPLGWSGSTAVLWDSNANADGGPVDGDGTWNTSSLNWWTGSANMRFVPGLHVAFGVSDAQTPRTVGLSTSPSVAMLSFTGQHYTLTADSQARTLALTGGLRVASRATLGGTSAAVLGIQVVGAQEWSVLGGDESAPGLTVRGAMSGDTGSIRKTGTGVMSLEGSWEGGRGIEVAQGKVLARTAAMGSGTARVASGAALVVQASVTNGIIVDAGGLVRVDPLGACVANAVTNAGTLRVLGEDALRQATVVSPSGTSSGQLLVGDGVAAASGQASRVVQQGVSIAANSELQLSAANTAPASVVSTFSLAGTTDNWTSRLDLGHSSLVVDYTGTSPATTIENQMACALGPDQDWTGQGVGTSATLPSGIGSVGLAEASDVLGLRAGDRTVWRGVEIDETSVLIGFTYAGDADMNSSVDLDDLFRLVDGYNAGRLGVRGTWAMGDFDLNGSVDLDDLFRLIDGFNACARPEPLTAVPEPGFAPLGLGVLGLRRRRRRVGCVD